MEFRKPQEEKRGRGKMSLEKEQREKNISYPRNLLKALKYDIETPTEDQILGLEFILGQLKESHREVVELHYKNCLTYRKISEQIGKSSARCSQIGITAIRRLQKMDWIGWFGLKMDIRGI